MSIYRFDILWENPDGGEDTWTITYHQVTVGEMVEVQDWMSKPYNSGRERIEVEQKVLGLIVRDVERNGAPVEVKDIPADMWVEVYGAQPTFRGEVERVREAS